MQKCEKSSKQKPEAVADSDYPNKGKLGDMGNDPRFYSKPVMNLAPVNIVVKMALAGSAKQIK